MNFPWMHVLLTALLAMLRTIGDTPARSLTALAQRLVGSEADMTTMVTPLVKEEPTPGAAVPPAAPGRVPKAQIINMALNGSGIRDTARVLKISPATVLNELKKSVVTEQCQPASARLDASG